MSGFQRHNGFLPFRRKPHLLPNPFRFACHHNRVHTQYFDLVEILDRFPDLYLIGSALHREKVLIISLLNGAFLGPKKRPDHIERACHDFNLFKSPL